MKKPIRELADQAGFVLWQDEKWNPGDVVDWSSRYDQELEQFADLIVQQCINAIDSAKTDHVHTSFDQNQLLATIQRSKTAIKAYFEVT